MIFTRVQRKTRLFLKYMTTHYISEWLKENKINSEVYIEEYNPNKYGLYIRFDPKLT